MGIETARIKRIFTLALPIIGGMLSQNVLNLVDTYMVGTLGNAALAAVGLGGFATFMCQALILGISTGVQTIASRRKGEGKDSETAFALNTGLLIVLVASFVFSGLLFFNVPAFYPYLNQDPAVIDLGVPYLQVRIAAIVFVGMNFSFRGYWNAVDLSKLYLKTILIMHACNILLNYVLIFGKLGFPAMGVTGAGLGTSISTAIGTFVYFFLGLKVARENGFLKSLPSFNEIKALVRLSIPNSIQQLFFAGGFTALYWIIGKVGTVELAATNIMINILLVAILPGIGMGLAAATLVGQALGRKQPDDAKRWGWDVAKICGVSLFFVTTPMWIAPEFLLGLFVDNPETIAVGSLPMRLTGFYVAIDAIGLVLMHSLLGAGDTQRVMYASMGLQWIFFLPLAYLIGPVLGYGLLGVWLLQAVYRLLQTGLFAFMWNREKWQLIKV